MTESAMAWSDYWERARVLATRLQPLATGHRLLIPPVAVETALLLLGAALHLELAPVFDEKAMHQRDAGTLVCPPALLPAATPRPSFRLTGAPPAAMVRALAGRTVSFYTSGSTGRPCLHTKGMPGLIAEAAALRQLYGTQPATTVLSLVRPCHIYGFLHAWLLPLIAGCDVVYWAGLPSVEDDFPDAPALLIMVPAHWHLLQTIWQRTPTPVVVSSGARFGRRRAAALAAFRDRYQDFFELFGSTETGAIGYRRADADDELFRLFSGTSLQAMRAGTRVRSAFLQPATQALTSDYLQQVGAEHFVHLGRSDRVFKYGGMRFSLGEIETTLRRVSEAATVCCRFHPDAGIPQGGYLEAWLESATMTRQDIPALRRRAAAAGLGLFPHRLHILPELPRDAQGKIALPAGDDSPALDAAIPP